MERQWVRGAEIHKRAEEYPKTTADLRWKTQPRVGGWRQTYAQAGILRN